MTIPINTVLKIAQNIVMPDEQQGVNVFWATVDDNVGVGPLDEDDIGEAAANWMDQLYANMTDQMVNLFVGGLVEVWTVGAGTGDLTPIADEAATWAGASAQDPFPNGVAAIVALKTTDTDVTGRKFIPGWAESTAVNNNIAAASLAELALFAVDWATQYTDANDVIFDPGVWSQSKLSFKPASGTVVANAILGYQRRRKPGVGS